jgi:sulfatase modifying factor 1
MGAILIRISIILFISQLLFMSETTFAGVSGLLFNVAATGTPANVSITLCLNGRGPLSCQRYTVSALNLSIGTVVYHHNYPVCGIKVNTPGYGLSGCTPAANGYCLFSASDSSQTNIVLSGNHYDLVTVTNPGNQNDSSTGFGAVGYTYQIGKYPITIAQYTNFLNAVAATDTYGLYNPNMATDLNIAGIEQKRSSGSYVYRVMDNSGISANRPITYISWFNAARFANWMSNGQPTGAEDSTTTENGAYALHGAVSGTTVVKNTINPNTGSAPTFYIPSNNEWYKAAYYNPNLNGGSGGYTLYATQSNTTPGNEISSSPNQANYFSGSTGYCLNGSLDYVPFGLNYLTDVGSFTGSPSFYGTFDQNGNVGQLYDLGDGVSQFYGSRGGYWFSGTAPLQSGVYSTDILVNSNSSQGFRLSSPSNT